MKKRIQLNGIIIFLAVFLLVLFPFKFLRIADNHSDDIVEILGLSFILFGQLLRISSRGYKSEQSLSGHSLVQDGPYSFVRNPMYLGIIITGLGVVLMLFKWWVVGIFITFFLIRYVSLIVNEEKMLIAHFGKDYLSYLKKVPRICQNLYSLFNRDIAEYLPLKISWIKKEIVSVLAVLFIVFIVEFWEQLGKGGLKTFFLEFMPFAIVVVLFCLMSILLAKRYENLTKKIKNTK